MAGMLDDGMELEAALAQLFQGLPWRQTQWLTPVFRCDCSRQRLEQALISLGRDELEDMIQTEHGAQLTCHFCNTQYDFNEADLRRLLQEATEDGKKKA